MRVKDTCIKRYGVENPFQSKEIMDAAWTKYKEKTGYEKPIYNPAVAKKIHKKYKYNEMTFDSSWEIIFYKWLIKQQKNFIFQPNIYFEYEFNGDIHHYYPDFIVEGKIIEIKGPQFFENEDPNGKMINPFDRSMDDLYEAKHQCMIKNGVIIITDISMYKKDNE